MTRRSYFVLFFSLASSKRSFDGTVSSMMMMFLVLSETRRMSGLKVVLCESELSFQIHVKLPVLGNCQDP